MKIFTGVQQNAASLPELTLTLSYHQRQKIRARVMLDNGEEAGLQLPRGTALKDGDIVVTEQGETAKVTAAQEALSIVYADDPISLTRACYHLGNRHVAVQINEHSACYLTDHVLDEMLQQMGLRIAHQQAMFEPESGAYAHGHHHD